MKAGDQCKFRGSAGHRHELLVLGEYDRYNKVWYAVSPSYGMMTVSNADIEKLPKDFKFPTKEV